MTDNGVIKRSIAKKYGRGKVLIETLCHFESKKKKKKIQNGLVIKYSLKIIFFVIFRWYLLVNDIVNFLYTFFYERKAKNQRVRKLFLF